MLLHAKKVVEFRIKLMRIFAHKLCIGNGVHTHKLHQRLKCLLQTIASDW